MPELRQIQKIMRAAHILTHIAAVLCVVAGGLLFSFAVILLSGGETLLELLPHSTKAYSLQQIGGIFLANAQALLLDGFICSMARRYFAAELEDGTPYATRSADKLRPVGLHCILFYVISDVVSVAIYKLMDIPEELPQSGDLLLGLVILLTAAVLKYGAQQKTLNGH